MTRERSFTTIETLVVDSRSDYKHYGNVDLFLDGADADTRQITPETLAAKLLADAVIHLAKLNAAFGTALTSDHDDILNHLKIFLAPLGSGDREYLMEADSPDDVFFNMLEGDAHPTDGLSESTGGAPDIATNNCFIHASSPLAGVVVSKASAAFFMLIILLDTADIRYAVGGNVELDREQMFRCFSHLLRLLGDLDIGEGEAEPGEGKMQKMVFVAGLKRLSADGIARDTLETSDLPAIH